jgi:hypothetical protein
MYRKNKLRRACFLGIFRELCALALRFLSLADDPAAALRQRPMHHSFTHAPAR